MTNGYRWKYLALYEKVSNFMMNGPCGKDYPNAPCMKDGKCSKGFPKEFQSRTIENSKSGNPLYRRRNNGSVVLKNGTELDNRWVVPFSPILLQKYNAHLNVEMCNSITAIKYLYKYVYKGHDRASIQLESESGEHVDEIKQYIDCRYVSASESYWRIAGFKLHGQFPSIYRLQIHLPNQQLVYFQEQDNAQDIIVRQSKTMLTEWFELNKIDSLAKEFSYLEAPSNFVWNSKDKKWKRRLRQQKGVLGRLYFVSSLAGEKFYLRILLHHVKGATSFESLKSINGEICETFKQACFKRGLLKDDQEWRDSLAEAASYKTGDQLLNLFSQILIFCDPKNPLEVWEEFKDQFIESALYSVSALYPQESLESTRAIAVIKALQDLQDYLEDKSKSLSDFGLPTPANGSSDMFDRNLMR